MRFLFIIKSFAQVAGVERVMSDKMNYLTNKGHDVTLLTYEQGEHPLIFNLNPSIKHIDVDCRFFTLHKLSTIKRLYRSALMKERFKKRITKVISDYKPDVIISPTYPLDIINELISTKGNAKLILESHMAYIQVLKVFNKQRTFFNRLVAKLYDRNTLRLLKKCDCMVVLTHGDKSFWSQFLTNVKVLPNPLTFYPPTIDDIKKDTNRIISIGRLTAIKRFDLLIDAFALISKTNPNWHLDIFGDGSDKIFLNKKISDLGLSGRIIIHPATNDIYSEMKRSQIMTMTSESEGFPLVLIEALSCGIPCISFDCPFGPGEIIEDNKNGLLVENGNINDFANKVTFLMSNPDLAIEMGKNARLSAERYKKDVIIERWEQLYLREAMPIKQN